MKLFIFFMKLSASWAQSYRFIVSCPPYICVYWWSWTVETFECMLSWYLSQAYFLNILIIVTLSFCINWSTFTSHYVCKPILVAIWNGMVVSGEHCCGRCCCLANVDSSRCVGGRMSAWMSWLNLNSEASDHNRAFVPRFWMSWC